MIHNKINLKSKKSSKQKIYFWSVIIILIILAIIAVFFVVINKLINIKYQFIIIGIILFLTVLVGILVTQKNNILKFIGLYVLIFSIVCFSYLMNILNDSINLINKVAITNNSIESTKIKPSDIAFNVYISGIDTYGEINTVSRSDVNIVATINLTKKQLLLTTIPRDSYVPIALGGQNQKDKLTHAGNYGIESSVKTVENLLNIKIPIYIKVNFSSFIKIIDILGGVEVNNPVAFDSFDKKHFPVGKIVLNGKEALSFTRERKSLSGGDVERGKNQQRVIEAVFNKMVQEKSLSNYQEIFNAISDSVQTNLSADSLIEIINKQTVNGNWHMESLSLEGYGQTGGLPSFAMPGYELYMYVLSDYSIQNAHNKILKVLEL